MVDSDECRYCPLWTLQIRMESNKTNASKMRRYCWNSQKEDVRSNIMAFQKKENIALTRWSFLSAFNCWLWQYFRPYWPVQVESLGRVTGQRMTLIGLLTISNFLETFIDVDLFGNFHLWPIIYCFGPMILWMPSNGGFRPAVGRTAIDSVGTGTCHSTGERLNICHFFVHGLNETVELCATQIR